MTIHHALHPGDGTDRLYMSRKEGRRKLANIKDCVDAPRSTLKQTKKD